MYLLLYFILLTKISIGAKKVTCFRDHCATGCIAAPQGWSLVGALQKMAGKGSRGREAAQLRQAGHIHPQDNTLGLM